MPAEDPTTEHSKDGSHSPGLADRIAFWLFLAMLALCPLPDGSIESNWIAVWVGVSGVVVVLASYRDLPGPVALLLLGLLGVIAAYVVVAVLQSVSPGPAPLPIWQEAAALTGQQIPPLSGSVRDAPLLFFGRPLLAALVLTAGIAVGADRARALLVCLVIVGTAVLYGLIGTMALLFSISALRPFDQGSSLTAFFLNKNTTATYLGSAVLIALALVSAAVRSGLRKYGTLAAVLSAPENRRLAVMAGAALFLMVLLPLTKSRAGLILTLLLAAGAFSPFLRRVAGNRYMLISGLLAMFALIYIISGESWRARQATVGFDSLGRFDAYAAQWQAITEHPWLGLGFGSFAQAFPQFRPPGMNIAGLVNIGHSTPLELAFEGGIPLALLVGGFVVLCGGILIQGARRRGHDPFILAGLLVGLLGILHSSMDFSLQIPGYLIICLAVVGIALRRALMEEEMVMVRRRSRKPEGPASPELSEALRHLQPASLPARPAPDAPPAPLEPGS